MKALTAYTHEIDNIGLAVSEILSQLQSEQSLCKNSVGIISCYPEFIDSGVCAALTEALPFDVIGHTTMASGIDEEYGFTMLSLLVLTGDDVSFSTALSEDITQGQGKPLKNMYAKALENLDGEPKMALVYAPIINTMGCELVVEALNEVCGGVPIFGTLASDHTDDYHLSQVIYEGKGSRNQSTIILISGQVNPRFSIMSIPEEKVLRQKALVTEAVGNTIISVNDMSCVDYMRTVGLVVEDMSINGISAIPVMVDYNNGMEPFAMGMLINEDGLAACGCSVPTGASLSIGTLLSEDIVKATETVVQQVLNGQEEGDGVALMYSCISRLLILGLDAEAELERIGAGLSGKLSHMISYSNGELCPAYDKDGKAVNRIHNFSLVSCVF